MLFANIIPITSPTFKERRLKSKIKIFRKKLRKLFIKRLLRKKLNYFTKDLSKNVIKSQNLKNKKIFKIKKILKKKKINFSTFNKNFIKSFMKKHSSAHKNFINEKSRKRLRILIKKFVFFKSKKTLF